MAGLAGHPLFGHGTKGAMMNQLFTDPRYNLGIPLVLLSIVLAVAVSSVTFWWMIAFFIVSMFIGTLQIQWGAYLQGKQTQWRAIGITLLFIAIAAPILTGGAWLGYSVIPGLFEGR